MTGSDCRVRRKGCQLAPGARVRTRYAEERSLLRFRPSDATQNGLLLPETPADFVGIENLLGPFNILVVTEVSKRPAQRLRVYNQG